MSKSLAALLVVAIFAAVCSEASISDPVPEDDFSEVVIEEEEAAGRRASRAIRWMQKQGIAPPHPTVPPPPPPPNLPPTKAEEEAEAKKKQEEAKKKEEEAKKKVPPPPPPAAGGAKNIFGQPLELCSKTGMAMTGFTRDGKCVEKNDDKGSHHVCIDLQDTAAAGGNFCKATGQPDWCDQKGECFGEKDKMCPRKGWCVCQWAFTGYVGKEGCDKVQKLNCHAVNYEALKVYTCGAIKHGEADGGKFTDALACLKKKCPGNLAKVTCP
jgi:uncharacterized protein (DUF2237 family)